MAGRFSVEAVFSAIDRMTGPIRKMESGAARSLKRLDKSMKQVGKVGSTVSRSFTRAGLAVGAGAAVTGAALADIIRVGSEFEQTMETVRAKMGATEKQFKSLEDAAKKMGATTEFSASQSAEALNFFATAGFTADQAIGALPGAIDLATAKQLDLGRATDIASDSLGAFGLMTNDSAQLQKNLARVNGVLVSATNSANFELEDMFQTIQDAAPTVLAAGQSMETFAALTEAMAGNGIKGTKAATALKNVVKGLTGATGPASAALKRLSIEVEKDGKMRDFTEVIGELKSGLSKMGDTARLNTMTDLFGTRALAGVSALLEQGTDGLRGFRSGVTGTADSVGKLAGDMRDTTSGSMKSFSSAIESIKITLFEAIKGPFRDIVDSLTKWARANKDVIASGFKDFVQFIKDNGDQIIGILTRVGKAAVLIFGLAKAMEFLSAAVTLVSAVMAATPLTLWIVGLSALAALVAFFWPEISAFFADVGDWIAEISSMIWDTLIAAWDAVIEAIRRVFDPVAEFFTAWAEFYVGALAIVFSVLGKVVGAWVDVFSFLFDKLSAFWSGVFELMQPVFDFLLTVWGKVADTAIVVLESLGGFLVDVFKTNLDIIGGLFDLLWEGVTAVFNATVAPILDKILGVVDTVRGIGRGVLGGDDSDEDAPGTRESPQVASPQERTATLVSEHTERNQSEVTIKDETGRASVTKPPKLGSGLKLNHSGAL